MCPCGFRLDSEQVPSQTLGLGFFPLRFVTKVYFWKVFQICRKLPSSVSPQHSIARCHSFILERTPKLPGPLYSTAEISSVSWQTAPDLPQTPLEPRSFPLSRPWQKIEVPFSKIGLPLQPRFRTVRHILRGEKEAAFGLVGLHPKGATNLKDVEQTQAVHLVKLGRWPSRFRQSVLIESLNARLPCWPVHILTTKRHLYT